MMFDAAVAATAEKIADSAASAAAADKPVATVSDGHADAFALAARTVSPDAASSAHEVIFIDTAVVDYQQLAQQWSSRGEVVLIDSSKDGIAQIQETLAGETNVSAVHIVSHGEQGAFYLGTTKVDQASIDGALAGSLAQIGSAINVGGDILIYGCDFAEGTAGMSALDAFAHATGRDVAASTDRTGASDLGGDWTLEAHDGTIEAHSLDATGWHHVLDPNTPVPISVQADSLIVTNAAGTVIVTGTTGYGSDNRSADVGQGATAVWVGAATYQGKTIDLKATVVSISTGDAIRFNRPGLGANADDATFLLRDLTAANDATVSIRWELIDHATGNSLPADVEFTISDIDGINGAPNTRESVSTSTDHLAYFTRERTSDIYFTSSLDQISASGTQNENTDTTKPTDPKSNATFDWTDVSAFTLTYKLTTNTVTTQAQFYHDGDADLKYTDPVYTSIPRFDLDADDSTAAGNDAHFTYTENGTPISVVDTDVRVSNPMDINSVTGATVVLTNAKAGDVLSVGTLPSNITATVSRTSGVITVTLSGLGSETDYDAALKAVSFSNTLDNPDTTQRVLNVAFSNAELTSATAVSRIDVIAVNDAPVRVGTLPARGTQDAATVSYTTAGAFFDPDGDTLSYTATGLPAGLTIDSATGVISGTLDRSASQQGGGIYNVVVTARDPSNAATTQSFRITVANPAPTARNDSVTTAEDTAVTINVLANDTDPDGDPLSVTGATAPSHGSIVRNADGTISYTPTANYNGTDSFTYAISDGQGGTSTATVTINITPVNDAPTPVGTLPARSTQDAATVSYPTAGGFTDVDGDTLSYSATGLPAGLTINASTGVISGTVDRSASQPNGGHYTVVVTARDPSNATATQSFTIDVSNPAPTAQNDSATTAEDTPVTIAVLANDSDPDGDPLTVTAASALHGTVVRNANGTLTYTPAGNYNGTDTISYTISDGQGGTSNATVAITITPVNDAPSRVGTLPAQLSQDAATVSYATAGGFTDVDGDTLTYSATGLPAGLTINASTGVISGTLGRSASQVSGGAYTIVVTATDPSNASTTQNFVLTVSNPAPTARDDTATTAEDTPVTITVLANDSDPDGDPLTVTAASALHGTVTRNADGTLTYRPNADYNGQDSISYTISDGEGGTSNAQVAITITPVNDAPRTTMAQGASYTVNDGQSGSLPASYLFVDPDGDTLTYTATGLPAGLSIDPATGAISGTVDRSASQVNGGLYTITLTATDPSGLSATYTGTLHVLNPVPAAQDDTATTAEDTPVTIPVLANDSDPDGDPLTVTAASAQHGTVTRNADGTLTYRPDPNFNGQDVISYTISDGEGGTSSAQVIVTVTPVNDAPAAIGTLPPQSTMDSATVSWATAGGFQDVDGDALRYSASGLPAGLSIDPMTGVISGTLDRQASQPQGGRYSVTVTAMDPSGAATQQVFAVDVGNPPPIAADDRAATHEGTPVTIGVLANDSDPDGDPLTVTAASAGHGTVTINPDGTLTYAPVAGFTGTDTIDYMISDGNGGTARAVVTVTVSNAPPVATDDRATTHTDTPVTIPVLGNDSDADGDPLSIVSASASHGAVTINPDGTLTYAPSAGFTGTDTIEYLISDGHGGTASAVVTVVVGNAPPVGRPIGEQQAQDGDAIGLDAGAFFSDADGDALRFSATGLPAGLAIDPVTGRISGIIDRSASQGQGGVYDAVITVSDGHGGTTSQTVRWIVTNPVPVAQDDTASTLEDQPVLISPLVNDRDPDGDPLSIVSATAGHGGVSINADGTLTYTPDANFNGADTIDYRITDGQGGFASAVIRVTVTPVNDAPVSIGMPPRADANGAPISLPVAPVVQDPDGDPLTYDADGLPPGITIDPTSGLISGDIAPGASHGGPTGNGEYPVTIIVTDPSGANVTIPFIWTIHDSGPVVRDDTGTTPEDTPVLIDVLANDRSPDGLPLAIADASATHGSVTIVGGGLIFTPDADFNGSAEIRYTVTDSDGNRASATATIVVTPVNDAPVANPDVATTPAGQSTDIAVLGNDRDTDGDPLTVTGASAVSGSVTINPDGTLHYVPASGFAGTDTIDYSISDGRGGVATGRVTITVTDHPPVAAADAASTTIGKPVAIPVLANDRDEDGETLTVTTATAGHGSVTIRNDGTLLYTPAAGFAGRDSIAYTVSDGRGGTATAQVTIDVIDNRSSDVQQRLGFGFVSGPALVPHRPGSPLLLVGTSDGFVRNPFGSLLTIKAVNGIRSLDGTRDLSTATPIEDAAEAARSLRNIGEIDALGDTATGPIVAEVERLERLSDFRDIGDRLFDHRWDDLQAQPRTGFSAAGVKGANVMMQTLVQGGAIYLDVRDTAPDKASEIRSIDVRLANGMRASWIHVDASGAAIIEPGADMDELHLVVSVTRKDGSHSRTAIVIQRATGEIEIDRQKHVPSHARTAARPLDATLKTPHAQAHAAAAHLHNIFK